MGLHVDTFAEPVKRNRMKKYGVLLMVVLLVVSCKKNGGGSTDIEPAVTPVGVNDGTAVTKTIGSAGGAIVSGDGEMELIIPSGALATNTAITIQPITNTAPNGRRKAYRCTPDGQQFAKDITIRFHYTDEDAAVTQPEYMQIAFQKADGTWQVIGNITNDVVAKTLSATVNHFTDFTEFDLLRLIPESLYLRKGATGDFQISWAGISSSSLVTFGLGILNTPPVWKVNGVTGGNSTHGTIRSTAPASATYTAPASDPTPNPVDISVEISIPFTVDGQQFNKGILLGKAYIIGNRYELDLEFKGTTAPGTGEVFSISDNVRMTVNLVGSGGTVSGAINVQPTFGLTNPSTNGCNTSWQSTGTGPINLRDIDVAGVTATGAGGYVYVYFDADVGVTPAMQVITCPGNPSQSKEFLPWSSAGAVLMFLDDTNSNQEINMSSAPGQHITLYVKPLQ
jgi:hypothetical protein